MAMEPDDYPIDPDTYREEPHSGKWYAADFPRWTEPVPFDSRNEEIFIISDLHIASGRDPLGVHTGSENFFADEAFDRFLGHAEGLTRAVKKRGLLVINGDSFDFLRVSEIPSSAADFISWAAALQQLGFDKTVDELRKSISDRERTYGLETDDYKTIYKLIKIREGHPVFFSALGGWMAAGHRLLMTKGNHDLEIVWPAVRHYIRLLLAEEVSRQDPDTMVDNALRLIIRPAITFRDDSVLVGKDLYIEHGHRYDKYTMVLDDPFIVLKKGKQINLPFGSFFNRYLINRLELAYPFLDKVRPGSNVVPMLVKENLPLAYRVFFKQIPLLLRILRTNRRYTRFMLGRITPLLLALIPILAFVIWVLWPWLANTAAPTSHSRLHDLFSNGAKTLGSGAGSLVLSYLLSRIAASAQLVEPSTLNAYARHVVNATKSPRQYKVMTMGHTHNPDACYARIDIPVPERPIFYNSGTWIPVIEIATAAVREDKTYTFLHLATDAEGGLLPHSNLLRWNDDAGREDPQLIIDPK
ncbi:MAG: hypothetical protein Q8943_11950 [Bacteroidota bacterium]|nr:hypothetical protein [Bacteroidota bacterium]